jgi:hypothetical protein
LQDFRTILHLHNNPVSRRNSQFFEGIAHFSGATVHLHVSDFLPLKDVTDMLTYRLIL